PPWRESLRSPRPWQTFLSSPPNPFSGRGGLGVSFGAGVRVLAVAFVVMMSALTAVASLAGPPSALSHPPGGNPDLSLGLGRVRTDKNCYLPGQTVTITLKNVGGAPLVYSSIPDFEVENDTIGTVRMVRDWQRGGFHLDP